MSSSKSMSLSISCLAWTEWKWMWLPIIIHCLLKCQFRCRQWEKHAKTNSRHTNMSSPYTSTHLNCFEQKNKKGCPLTFWILEELGQKPLPGWSMVFIISCQVLWLVTITVVPTSFSRGHEHVIWATGEPPQGWRRVMTGDCLLETQRWQVCLLLRWTGEVQRLHLYLNHFEIMNQWSTVSWNMGCVTVFKCLDLAIGFTCTGPDECNMPHYI